MKAYFLFSVLLFTLNGIAQNVGISTTTPSEKLDVNGNVNVQGNIRMSGVAGTDGQVLMTNNTGATIWSDLCDFKNIASYTQNGTWPIPAGVTKIMIEAWGGGGGGSAGGGGAGGTYIRTQTLVVSPGTISITIGTGGAGAATEAANASNGTQTTVSGGMGTYTALQGGGAFSNTGGSPSTFSLSGDSFMQFPGQAGSPTTYNYAQRTAGQFVEIRNFGSGGGTFPFYNTGGQGGTFVQDLGPLLPVRNTYPTAFIKFPGSGGGGGLTNIGSWGSSGANGMAIIHY